MSIKQKLLFTCISVFCFLLINCDRVVEQTKYVPLSIDFTVNGNSKVIPTNLYAGIPYIKDVEKVFQVNTNSTTQLSAAISPTNRVENIEWFLDDEDIPFATSQKISHDFTTQGLHKLYVCINDSYKCTSKYIYVEGAKRIPEPEPESKPKIPVVPKPNPEPKPVVDNDVDNDGIPNINDACLNEPGLAKFNGCPDSDGDDIPDKYDRYPNIKGGKEHDVRIDSLIKVIDTTDTDKDGIIDTEDRCPREKGVAKYFGCPPPIDTDKDGIIDTEDKCPREKGVAEYFGCPPPPPPIIPPPPVEEPEPECNTTKAVKSIGPLAKDRCPTPAFIGEAQIQLKPKRCISLKSISLSANASGKIIMYLTNDKGRKSDEVTATVNAGGTSQITKIKEVYMSLQAGRTYTLHIAPITNNLQFENLSSCNTPAINDENLSIDYNGQAIVMDLNYAY